jgi:hypothetical protein
VPQVLVHLAPLAQPLAQLLVLAPPPLVLLLTSLLAPWSVSVLSPLSSCKRGIVSSFHVSREKHGTMHRALASRISRGEEFFGCDYFE